MATDAAIVAINITNLALLAMSAAVGWLLPHRAAKVFAVGATAGLAIALLGYPLSADDPAAWGRALRLWTVVLTLLGVVIVWIYPARPTSRLERAFIVAYVAWVVGVNVFDELARDWLLTVPPGVDLRTTAKWYWLSLHSPIGGFLQAGVAVLWLRRSIQLGGVEGRAGAFWVTVQTAVLPITASYFVYMLWNVFRFGNFSYHEVRPVFWNVGGVYGDPLHTTALLWLLGNGAVLAFVAYATYMRQFATLGIFLVGLLLHYVRYEVDAAADPFTYVSALHTLLVVVAITEYGVFGARTLPRWAGLTLAGGLALALFFGTVSIAAAISSDPLVSSGGIALGLLLAALAVVIVLRRVEGMPLRTKEDPATTRSRIEPYHAMLVQELSSGTSAKETFEKLRTLRARLGVSDHEHALLEYASSTAQVARLTERSVQPGVTFLSRYRVIRTLKEGGMGITHLAVDERVGRRVVLKTLRSTRGAAGLGDLLKEARALGRVEHANVVNVIDADVVGEEAFLVMEYVDGGSLADRLPAGPLSRPEFERVADDLLAALDAVHEAGLVHRDVKPSNVLLTLKGVAKLADFGVAHLPGFETTVAAMPHGGAIGTIRYMSPEQARGRPAGIRSDLYSAGLVLYEAWTGRAYVDLRAHESAVELQLRVAATGGFDRDDVPPALRAWLGRALHPIASERFETARAMRDSLRDALR